jgi:immune inhibitor A
LAASALVGAAAAPVAAQEPKGEELRNLSDDLISPHVARHREMRQAALEAVLRREVTPRGRNMVVQLPGNSITGIGPDHRPRGGKYVELAFEGEDQILTLLGEFGDTPATHNHGALGDINHGGDPGPQHNQIPEPNRLEDNTTIWEADFSQDYYDNLLYNKDAYPSMANYYLEQSSGAYSVDGYVSDWVQVPNNAAAYGSNYCGSIVCTRDIGRFIEDQADTWWDVLVAEQGSVGAANAWLATFDVWDRYDWDGDGNFDEPDGYIDHFQSVHAGEGEETGGGAQGEDAIWSHRSSVNSVPFGTDGPDGGPQFGGAQIGSSEYWIYDYTIEPENGGVGVFAHEFAHDLDLPDEYDTSGNTAVAENSTGWWTLMSQGSYGTQTTDIGSAPTHMNAWDKFQLGFLDNINVAYHTESGRFILGPAEYNTNRPQAMFIVLPDKNLVTDVWDPYAGDWMYFSGRGNDLDNNMTREITLGAGPIDLSFQAKYHIETCWDYAYVEVSTDGGSTFEPIANSAESDENTNGSNFGHGITGVSGQPGNPSEHCDDLSASPEWVNVTADLSAYANSTVHLRFRYWTDGAVVGDGFTVDNIEITGLAMDGAETDPGWVYEGFRRSDGTVTDSFFNAYVLENRQYIGYDDSLARGPYNFGFPDKPNFVEHFRLQNGLLIWYWDNSFQDNNVSEHPGGGLILPVDSHPGIQTWSDGSQMRPRIQSYDATFTKARTEAITLHNPADGVAKTITSKGGVSVFNDNRNYWKSGHASDDPDGYQAEWNSVDTPNTGTVVKILSDSPLRVVLRLNP